MYERERDLIFTFYIHLRSLILLLLTVAKLKTQLSLWLLHEPVPLWLNISWNTTIVVIVSLHYSLKTPWTHYDWKVQFSFSIPFTVSLFIFLKKKFFKNALSILMKRLLMCNNTGALKLLPVLYHIINSEWRELYFDVFFFLLLLWTIQLIFAIILIFMNWVLSNFMWWQVSMNSTRWCKYWFSWP